MKNAEHTPEPWTYCGGGFSYVEDAKSEFVICSMRHPQGQFWLNHEANARRIIACVNACKGIGTEALEAAVVEGILLDFTRPIAEAENNAPSQDGAS